VEKHIHVAGITIVTVLAITGAAHFLIRTVAAHHPNNPFWQAMAYLY
jgi:hypothetical protein